MRKKRASADDGPTASGLTANPPAAAAARMDPATATAAGVGAGVSGSFLGMLIGANLATKACPKCGQTVDRAATRCPRCGGRLG